MTRNFRPSQALGLFNAILAHYRIIVPTDLVANGVETLGGHLGSSTVYLIAGTRWVIRELHSVPNSRYQDSLVRNSAKDPPANLPSPH